MLRRCPRSSAELGCERRGVRRHGAGDRRVPAFCFTREAQSDHACSTPRLYGAPDVPVDARLVPDPPQVVVRAGTVLLPRGTRSPLLSYYPTTRGYTRVMGSHGPACVQLSEYDWDAKRESLDDPRVHRQCNAGPMALQQRPSPGGQSRRRWDLTGRDGRGYKCFQILFEYTREHACPTYMTTSQTIC